VYVKPGYFYPSAKEVVFVVVCLLAALRKNCRTDLHEIFRKGWQWANEQMIKFWCRSVDLKPICQMVELIS